MDDKAIQLVLNKLEELGRDYGPAFTEQAVRYAHIKAFENSVLPLFVSCVFSLIAYKTYSISAKEWKKDYRSRNDELGIAATAACCFSSAAAFVTFLCSLNVSAWYGLFDPATYLSYRLFEKVL